MPGGCCGVSRHDKRGAIQYAKNPGNASNEIQQPCDSCTKTWRWFDGTGDHVKFSFKVFSSRKKTSSNPTLKARARRKANSREGVYFPFSIATMVWRVTFTFSANCCWVISPW